MRTFSMRDMSKAFDTVHLHKFINKLISTNIPNTITKYIANYIKGRSYTTHNLHNSKQRTFHTGVPQGGVLSPTLFNLYLSDIPLPPPEVTLTTYADDITITSSHQDIQTTQNRIQPYLQEIYQWTVENNLTLNPEKTTSTLFTPVQHNIATH